MLWKKDELKVCPFGPTLTFQLPLKMAEIKKKSKMRRNFNYSAIQICQNQSSIYTLLSGENAISICTIWVIFGRKQGKVKAKWSGIKIPHIFFTLTILGQLPERNSGCSTFQFRGYRLRRTFRKYFNTDFQVWLLFLTPNLNF